MNDTPSSLRDQTPSQMTVKSQEVKEPETEKEDQVIVRNLFIPDYIETTTI